MNIDQTYRYRMFVENTNMLLLGGLLLAVVATSTFDYPQPYDVMIVVCLFFITLLQTIGIYYLSREGEE